MTNQELIDQLRALYYQSQLYTEKRRAHLEALKGGK